ncbi:MAG: hypothetical protein V3V22_10435 [Methylococcales bacterium]
MLFNENNGKTGQIQLFRSRLSILGQPPNRGNSYLIVVWIILADVCCGLRLIRICEHPVIPARVSRPVETILQTIYYTQDQWGDRVWKMICLKINAKKFSANFAQQSYSTLESATNIVNPPGFCVGAG